MLFWHCACCVLPALRGTRDQQADARQEFLVAAKQSEGPISILDIGANNGAWSDSLMQLSRSMLRSHVQLDLLMIEPQIEFQKRLESIAARWKGVYLQAAAWTNDTVIEFFSSQSNLEASSVARASARRWGRYRARAVRGLNSSRLIMQAPAVQRAKLLLLKLDIEGGEYTVLPHLLMSGALCRADFLLIEWHLNAIPPEQRLSGLSLRHSIDTLLASGCSTRRSPPRIFHLEYDPVNRGMYVPGLLAEAIRHTWSSDTTGDVPVDTSKINTTLFNVFSKAIEAVPSPHDTEQRRGGMGWKFNYTERENMVVEESFRQTNHVAPAAGDREADVLMRGSPRVKSAEHLID